MEFITLTKNDPEFEPHLLGTFSRSHRALPVETFHAETARERVTFRVIARDQIAAPAWWKIYFLSSRPELIGLTLGPAVAAWLNQRSLIEAWSQWPSWLALLGIYFLHTAVFLFNDVQDHLRGLDRLNRRRGSQVIQKGWVSAAEMRRWALVNLAVAIALGLPAVIHSPAQLFIVCALAAVALLVLAKKFWVRQGMNDLAIMLLFGPLLTSGIALSSFGMTNSRDLLLGIAFGSLTLWVFQVRQFEDLFRSKPQDFRTFLAHWNFEQARRIGVGEGVLLLLIQPAMALLLAVPVSMLAMLPLVSAPTIWLIAHILKAASPLSSSLVNCKRAALIAHFAWSGWWIAVLGFAWL